MNIVGKWKVAKHMGLDAEENMVWLTKEDYMKTPAYDPEDSNDPFKNCYFFSEDHTISTLMPIPAGVPQSDIDEAVASGAATVIDGMLLLKDKDPMEWKEENGEVFVKFKEEGAEVDWKKLDMEDGLLTLLFAKLEKAD